MVGRALRFVGQATVCTTWFSRCDVVSICEVDLVHVHSMCVGVVPILIARVSTCHEHVLRVPSSNNDLGTSVK